MYPLKHDVPSSSGARPGNFLRLQRSGLHPCKSDTGLNAFQHLEIIVFILIQTEARMQLA